MTKLKRVKKRTTPFHVEGLGLVPMLYVEVWGLYEAYRRLGFKDEETEMVVGDTEITGTLRRDVIHVCVKAQGLTFNVATKELDRSFAEAQKLIFDLKTAIAEHRIPHEQLTQMYRSTDVGHPDGQLFLHLGVLLTAKGFNLRALAN